MTHFTAAAVHAVQGWLSLANSGSLLSDIFGAAYGDHGVQP